MVLPESAWGDDDDGVSPLEDAQLLLLPCFSIAYRLKRGRLRFLINFDQSLEATTSNQEATSCGSGWRE
jgi:hypothetical protein